MCYISRDLLNSIQAKLLLTIVETYILAILTLIIGIVVTIIVGRYYYFRTVNKSLSANVQYASAILEGIDSSVRDTLEVKYRGIKVSNLYQLQLIITNDGDRPIRDCITPLSLKIPQNTNLLEAVILDVHPKGRDVNIKINEVNQETVIEFHFPLLNKRDLFVCKLLLDGLVNIQDLTLQITAEDLPPSISIRDVASIETETSPSQSYSFFITIALLFSLFAFGSILTTYFLYMISTLAPTLDLASGAIDPTLMSYALLVLSGFSAFISFIFLIIILFALRDLTRKIYYSLFLK